MDPLGKGNSQDILGKLTAWGERRKRQHRWRAGNEREEDKIFSFIIVSVVMVFLHSNRID